MLLLLVSVIKKKSVNGILQKGLLALIADRQRTSIQ